LAALRERLHHDTAAWQALNDIFSQLTRYPERLREVLLTDGYLYAERPDLASLLANGVSLDQLFTERELEITRGSVVKHAVRKHREYQWADGADAGQPARLWLFDRVSIRGQAMSPNKHVALGDLRERLGATRVEVERLSADAALAQVSYGEQAVAAVLAIRDGEFELECEVVPPAMASAVEESRALRTRHARLMERLQTAIAEQVAEGLPFDEPKTEEGQQDGKLRQEWRSAYRHGYTTYEFNGDEYRVFGAGGIPRIPQVCVDFITDTWERMAGTRWGKRNEGRRRFVGRLDFDTLDIENRRSVENLIDFAVAHPEWFELMLIPESERIPFAERSRFFRRLYDLRTEFQPGDVVAILGPRDDDKLHYHSFFILADDPLTSMPTTVAANAGRPRIRTWEGEMQNAPRRSIIARIRPRQAWLESITAAEPVPTAELAAK
ncbi:MAG TPA: hypothetical protein VKP30_17140, partial [Polyangiaceae bacterium]|nr:hypothetical protein [Polyangiaceae bacterium]